MLFVLAYFGLLNLVNWLLTLTPRLRGHKYFSYFSPVLTSGIVVLYALMAWWISTSAIIVTYENKSPWVDLNRPQNDNSVSVFIKPSHRLNKVVVTVHSLILHKLGYENSRPINGNIDIPIGCLCGADSFKPIDIDTNGRFWPIIFIPNSSDRPYILCDLHNMFECKYLYKLADGHYTLKLRISAGNETSVDKTIQFDLFGDSTSAHVQIEN